MAQTPESPFTEADRETLKVQLKALDEAESLVRKAKQAGIDLGDQEQRVKDLRLQIMKIKQTFFPGT